MNYSYCPRFRPKCLSSTEGGGWVTLIGSEAGKVSSNPSSRDRSRRSRRLVSSVAFVLSSFASSGTAPFRGPVFRVAIDDLQREPEGVGCRTTPDNAGAISRVPALGKDGPALLCSGCDRRDRHGRHIFGPCAP